MVKEKESSPKMGTGQEGKQKTSKMRISCYMQANEDQQLQEALQKRKKESNLNNLLKCFAEARVANLIRMG